MSASVEVYGRSACENTRATRAHLDTLGVQYTYVDVAETSARPAAADIQEDKTPIVVISGAGNSPERRVLDVPSDTELDAVLDETGVLPLSPRGDGSPGVSPGR